MISNFKNLQGKKGQIVEITGIYHQVNGAKRQGQFAPSGYASVELASGERIVLGIQDEGLRPKEEIEQLEGKKVIAKGTYAGFQTLWGDGTVASIVSEALVEVEWVKAI